MGKKMKFQSAIVLAAFALACGSEAQLLTKTNWANPNGAAGAFDPASTVVGNSALDGATFTYINANDEIFGFRVGATSTENRAGPADRFSIIFENRQNLTVTGATNVTAQVPLYTKGFAEYIGSNGGFLVQNYFGNGRINARVRILDTSGPADVTVLTVERNIVIPSPPTLLFPGAFNFQLPQDTFDFGQVELDHTKAYRVEAKYTIEGSTASGANLSNVGDIFRINMRAAADTKAGFYSHVTAVPIAEDNSRAQVTAVLARNRFGLDGTGINVGLIETFNPVAHTSLGARLLAKRPGTVAGNFQGEHATATSTIIAGDDPNGSNFATGIAPGASIVPSAFRNFGSLAAADAPTTINNTINDMFAAANVNLINMSAGLENLGAGLGAVSTNLDTNINAKPNVTFVVSAGNDGTKPPNNIGDPARAYNAIAVGSVNGSFARSSFSSYSNGALPIKPDIVAPGEFIRSGSTRDLNNNGALDDYNRSFIGDFYDGAALQHDITGTSFSAPHVAGAVALMQEYQKDNAGTHDLDHRVLKAVLLHAADRKSPTHNDGVTEWNQATTGSLFNGTYKVTRSLDVELGSGLLDTERALEVYTQKEARAADNNNTLHFNIDVGLDSNVFGTTRGERWDLEKVLASGTVNYILGNIDNNFFEATLTWDSVAGVLNSNLELKLFREGFSDFNVPGFDVADPNADVLIAQTDRVGENVKLLTFDLPAFGPQENPGFYLQVFNRTAVDTTYGIAFSVPEPGMMGVVLLGGLLASRRRRA